MNMTRCLLYVAVIGAAMTLHHPVMIALQSAMGGIMLGMWLERWRMQV
jgi:hypothetical protein